MQDAERPPFTDITNGEFSWLLILSSVLFCIQAYGYTDSHWDYAVPSTSSQIRQLNKTMDVAPLIGNHLHGDQSSHVQVSDASPLMENAKGEYSNSFMINLYNCRMICSFVLPGL